MHDYLFTAKLSSAGPGGVGVCGKPPFIRLSHEIFPKRFSPTALAALCRMEVEAAPYDATVVANQLQQKNCRLIGFSVSGDVLFEADPVA